MNDKITTKVFRFFDFVAATAGLNLLFVLCSIPIITIGTSLTALYAGLRAMAKGEPCYRAFFHSFRKSFVRSTLLWILLSAVNLFFLDSLVFSLTQEQSSVIALVCSAVFVVVFLCIATMVFLFYSRFEGTVVQILKHSVSLFFSHPLRTLLICVLTWGPFVLFILFPPALMLLGMVWLFFYFAAVSTVAIWVMNRPFIRFARDVLGMDVPPHPSNEI